MDDGMTQEERLNYLLKAFKEDSVRYKDLPVPPDGESKRQLLRSLMNIRMPKMMAAPVLAVQDAYLRERAREKGLVHIPDIPTAADKGSCHPYADRLSIWQGDITRLSVDAIVNAANSQMLGCFIPMHSCIDNCIHTFAGVQLRLECNRQMNMFRRRYGNEYEQPTAVPMLTEAYNLPAGKVVHVVGPVVEDSLSPKLEEELAACYRNTLDMCAGNGLRSVAFCCISTGVFHFPNKRAAEIAVKTVTDRFTKDPDSLDRVIFNVFKDEDRVLYERLLF